MPARPATHQALVADAGGSLLVELLDPLLLVRLRTCRRLLLDRARQLNPQPLELGLVLLLHRAHLHLRIGARLVAQPLEPGLESLNASLPHLQLLR